MDRRVTPDQALRRDSWGQRISGVVAHSAERPIRPGRIRKGTAERPIRPRPDTKKKAEPRRSPPESDAAYGSGGIREKLSVNAVAQEAFWVALPMSGKRKGHFLNRNRRRVAISG